MRCKIPSFMALMALIALGGCGDSESASTDTSTSTTAAATTTAAPAATPASANPAKTSGKGDDSGYVVVTSLLGKELPKEPGCRFDKTFLPDKPSPSAYDGALLLTVKCPESDGFNPTGQIVNRAGSKPTEITCRTTKSPELYCIYVPSSSVGMYFTGTDRATVRRRLEHLIETVAPLPAGITPLSGASAP